METRVCKVCRVERDIEAFPIRKGAGKPYSMRTCKWCEAVKSRKYYEANRETRNAYSKEYAKSHPEVRRLIQVKSLYGLTREEYDALPDECAICHSVDDLHIDHDHDKMVVRGRLCGGCNRAIGIMKDSPERLRAAAEYLERANGEG